MTAVMSGGTIPDTGDYAVILEPQAHDDRQRQRGLRDREHRRRHLPARQRQLPDPARRTRPRARRGRAGHAAEHPVLARRGAGAHRRTVGRRVAPARGDRRDAWTQGERRACDRAGWSTDVGLATKPRRASSSTTSRASRPRSACCRRSSTLAMERFFDESGGTQLVIHSPYGSRINRAWGLALRKRFCRKFNFELQAAATEDAIVLSLSTSHSFPLIEVAHYLHSNSAVRRAGAGAARRAAVRRALALERDHRAGAAALRRRQEGRAATAADEVRGPAGDGVPGPGRLRREPGRRARGARPSAGRADAATTACTRRWTPTAGWRCCAGWNRGEVADRRARPHRALAVRRRGAERAPVRVPRRRAAGGAPHPGGDEPPLRRRRQRRRPRPARPGRDRGGARGGLAAGAQRRRDARGADGPGLRHRRTKRRPMPAGRTGCATLAERPSRARAPRRRSARPVVRRRTPAAGAGAVSRGDAANPRSRRPPNSRAQPGRARTRWSNCCARA